MYATALFLILTGCFPLMISSTSIIPDVGCAPVNVGYQVGEDHVAFSRGCYHSGGSHKLFPATADPMVNFRGQIDWALWGEQGSGKQVIVKCAQTALERGAPSFGIEFYGECYTGSDADLSLGEVTEADGCSQLCGGDTGAANVVFVFDLFEWYTE
ncbi:Pod-EPPT protein [Elysia marginata]|uniref:Pod-EPPT protein n=1 Tax=Elysia marginata TaxID=1093978 RepID=A0AAV4IY66_9GAST|nr:Pod-EPPT protein [Elysia marginata]